MACSVEGCDLPRAAKGWCSGHYQRWCRTGDPVDHRPSTLDRWRSKVDTSGGPDACWSWTAGHGSNGQYGTFHDGTDVLAHRWAYEHFVGPIPDRKHVLHRCDNPPCVNPAHLFVGTNADNVADKIAKGRARYAQGERVNTAKLTEDNVCDIRRRVAAGEAQVLLAAEYGVTKGAINCIVHRRNWKHVT